VFTAPDRDPSVIFEAIYGAVALLNVAAPLGVVLTYGVYSAVLGTFRAGLICIMQHNDDHALSTPRPV